MPAAFVMMTPDPFASNFSSSTEAKPGGEVDFHVPTVSRDFGHVRRPVRGIVLKEETFATLQVRKSNGEFIPLVDSGGYPPAEGSSQATSENYSNFLLQDVTETRSEKQQIVETFGEPYIFFYGEQPRMLSVHGTLLNTADFNWRAEFWENYNNFLRGTKCVENRARVYLSWDDIVVEGYFLTAMAKEVSSNSNIIDLNFVVFLTNYQNISSIGDYRFPQPTNVDLYPQLIDGGEGKTTNDLWLNRQLNLQLDKMGDVTKNSLYGALKKGLSYLVDAEGKIQSYLDLASNFLAGRSVRVPKGFESAAIYDDLQIAYGSVDYQRALQDSALVDVTGQSVELFKAKFSKLNYTVRYPIPPKQASGDAQLAMGRGFISDNKDEYIARKSGEIAPEDRWSSFVDFNLQKASDDEAAQKVSDVYKKFGVIDLSPANDVLKALKTGTFLVKSLENYQQFTSAASTYSSSLSVTGTIESAIGGGL
jgi:hypothetical protein